MNGNRWSSLWTSSVRQRLASRGTVALLLAVATVILLTATASDMGLTWDEPAYIAASESYTRWLGELVTHPATALSASQIQAYWTPNHEHPPLDKFWSGVVWAATRFMLDDLVAHRLGNILLVGALATVVYMWVEEVYGRVAGLAAAGALMAMPRFFFHAHLAALDVPAACSVVFVTFLFWKTRKRSSWIWGIWLGLAWGAALATKINAVFVLPTLLFWTLLFRRQLYLIARLAVTALIGIPFACMLWPWLYYNTWARLVDYVEFQTIKHWPIGQWYLGQFYMPPLWHFVFVMLWAVVPLTLTILYVIGAVRAGREWKSNGGVGWLFILSAVVPLFALASGQSMVYDNERLFMPTFPFLAALAGIGLGWLTTGLSKLVKRLHRPRPAVPLAITAAAVTFLIPVINAASLYPHLLSYYSEGIGGLPAAVSLGLDTTYWCETYAAALPYLNANAQPDDIIWVEPWSYDVMIYYQLHGRLRPDVWIANPYQAESVFSDARTLRPSVTFGSADFVVFDYHQSYFASPPDTAPLTPQWLSAHRGKPVFQLSHQGVPLMEIYTGGNHARAGGRVGAIPNAARQ